MGGPATFLLLALSALIALNGCKDDRSTEHYTRPDQVLSFDKLFGQNCAGCHGQDGRWGPAPPLNDALFLQVISDDQLRQVIAAGRQVEGAGRRGTLMPAHSKKHGGTLTPQQIDALVSGIRKKWGAPKAGDETLPRYAVTKATTTSTERGDTQAGQKLFRIVCARCHGPKGEGKDAGALHDSTFLLLVSRQLVRRTVIIGRPDLGMPDYRELGNKSHLGRPLTNEEITNIVAYVETWRPVPQAGIAQENATQPAMQREP